MKDTKVCKGCRYYMAEGMGEKSFCNFLTMTGKSRLVLEEKNGGYKEDSCICYKPKPKGRRKMRNEKIVWEGE